MAVDARSFRGIPNNDITYVREMGRARNPNNSATQLFGQVFLKMLEKQGPGKKFLVDLAVMGSQRTSDNFNPTYFNGHTFQVYTQVEIHSMITGQWRSLPEIHLGLIKGNTMTGPDCWNSGGRDGYYKPRYGMVEANYHAVSGVGIVNASMSASAADQAMTNAGHPPYISGRLVTHFGGEPVGIRYLSNGGWWSSTRQYVPCTVAYNFAPYSTKGKDWLDGGTSKEGKLVEFSAEAGDDRWRLDIRIHTEVWDDDYYWDVFEGELINKIDNPLLGYPDVKLPGQEGWGWPPRYDARFFVKQNGRWVPQNENQNLQGQIKDGSWKVF